MLFKSIFNEETYQDKHEPSCGQGQTLRREWRQQSYATNQGGESALLRELEGKMLGQ